MNAMTKQILELENETHKCSRCGVPTLGKYCDTCWGVILEQED